MATAAAMVVDLLTSSQEPLSRVVRDIAPERDLPTADAPVTGGSDPYLAILSTQLRAHANDGGGDSADDISLLACAAREFWESGEAAVVQARPSIDGLVNRLPSSGARFPPAC